MDNLAIWNHADKIDPNYTKKNDNGGYSSLSLNGHWFIKKATELFGPMGIKWGFDIDEERFDQGATIWHPPSLKTDKPVAIGKVVTHTLKVTLWYELDEGKKGSITNYGHTPYTYQTKNGIKTDGEAPKKSLTDAQKKCLSMLGFAGDVYLGEYDNPQYMNVVRTEFDIENAQDKDSVIDQKREDLITKIEDNLECIRKAITPNEAVGIRKTILRYLLLQTKIPELNEISTRGMKAIDLEYTKRLQDIKKESDNGTD